MLFIDKKKAVEILLSTAYNFYFFLSYLFLFSLAILSLVSISCILTCLSRSLLKVSRREECSWWATATDGATDEADGTRVWNSKDSS